MKELDQFTVERLTELSTRENLPEVAALARIALAAKMAEPVAYLTWHQGCRSPDDCEDYLNAYTHKTEEKSCDNTAAFPVYASPVLNSPEIPDGWVMAPKEPTGAMLSAAKEWTGLTETAKVLYREMLAAAPKPEK